VKRVRAGILSLFIASLVMNAYGVPVAQREASHRASSFEEQALLPPGVFWLARRFLTPTKSIRLELPRIPLFKGVRDPVVHYHPAMTLLELLRALPSGVRQHLVQDDIQLKAELFLTPSEIGVSESGGSPTWGTALQDVRVNPNRRYQLHLRGEEFKARAHDNADVAPPSHSLLVLSQILLLAVKLPLGHGAPFIVKLFAGLIYLWAPTKDFSRAMTPSAIFRLAGASLTLWAASIAFLALGQTFPAVMLALLIAVTGFVGVNRLLRDGKRYADRSANTHPSTAILIGICFIAIGSLAAFVGEFRVGTLFLWIGAQVVIEYRNPEGPGSKNALSHAA